MSSCSACGQALPLPFDIGIELSPRRRELLEIVYRAGRYGIATERVIELLYGNDPNGGPENARKTVHIRVCQLNKLLAPRGWRIYGRGAHNGFYILEKLIATPASAVTIIREVTQ
jgi:hypothetical protein